MELLLKAIKFLSDVHRIPCWAEQAFRIQHSILISLSASVEDHYS